MDPIVSDARWEHIKNILHQAMQLTPDQRARFLDEACPHSDPCRAEIDSLLVADDDARSNFLRTAHEDKSHEFGDLDSVRALAPGGENHEFGDLDSVRALAPGGENHEFGDLDSVRALAPGDLFEQRFQLIEVLGEGGMGQVWLARQIAPVHRQIALKLIKAGMYDESVVRRFRAERQSLAMMEHPAIAKVFEAGATAQGQPYLVMEYVPGLSITNYCDQHRLGIRARLELLIQACEGVQHAHQKAIVHRDLKPSNILVVEVDGKPVPRIIDFGLAKATTPQLLPQNEFTRLGQFVGTPGYMSPEQADPETPDIDTRTDVYSLGVVLYVLLTGYQPFDVAIGRRPPLDVLLRQLREEDPPPPSVKLVLQRDSGIASARLRRTDARTLIRELRGDLDGIALKALERDRGRRYGTSSDLAADLRRHLNDEPVVARPAGTLYRLRKYTRRHRIAVSVAAGLVGLLAAFSVLQSLELRRTTEERDRANRERDRATRITDFMTGMFKVADPSEARGNSVTAREILDKASAEIGSGLKQDAGVQAQMLDVMANTYLNLGIYARAHELSERALTARTQLYGDRNPQTMESMTQMGWILDRQGQHAEAEKLERQALETERRVLGPEAPLTLETMDHLAVIDVDEGRYGESERLAKTAMESAARTLGAENGLTLQSTNHYATALLYQGRYADAEREYRRLLEIDRRVLGSDHPQTLPVMINLAYTEASQSRVTEAERLYEEVLDAQRRVLGPEHQYTLLTMSNLADLLTGSGRLAEGEKLDRDVLNIRTRTLGADHPDTLISKVNLAGVLTKKGHLQEAETLQRAALADQQRVLGPQNPETLYSQSNLAAILIREHRYDEAERTAQPAFDIQSRTLGQDHPDTLNSLRIRGIAQAHLHRYGEASKLLQSAVDRAEAGRDPQKSWLVWYAYACVAAAAGRVDDALEYLRTAISRGYKDGDGLLADDDLKDLRPDPRFEALIGKLRDAAPAQ